MASIADRLGVSGEHPLVVGSSFQKNDNGQAFHTIRYDFKPASVDSTKMAAVEVGENHSVTVSVPHVEGSQHTVYKGNSRTYPKECVLIIDHDTGQIRLEKLVENIQVKKTRSESGPPPRLPPMPRPLTPIDPVSSRRTSPNQRLSPHGGPKPARAAPTVRRGSPVPSQQAVASSSAPQPQAPPLPGSMPVFGLEDDSGVLPFPTPPPSQSGHNGQNGGHNGQSNGVSNSTKQEDMVSLDIGELSESDSDSDSSSDSDMDVVESKPAPQPSKHASSNGRQQNGVSQLPSMPSAHLLTDLQLSDSD